MTTTLSTGQSQEQTLALSQDHQQHYDSTRVMNNGCCHCRLSDHENIVTTSAGQLEQQTISYIITSYDIDHETMSALAELEQTLQLEDDCV